MYVVLNILVLCDDKQRSIVNYSFDTLWGDIFCSDICGTHRIYRTYRNIKIRVGVYVKY